MQAVNFVHCATTKTLVAAENDVASSRSEIIRAAAVVILSQVQCPNGAPVFIIALVLIVDLYFVYRLWCLYGVVSSAHQEWQDGEKSLVIDDTATKQTIYMYKCTNSVLQVKGKVNNITMGERHCHASGYDYREVRGIRPPWGKCPPSISGPKSCKGHLFPGVNAHHCKDSVILKGHGGT